MRPSVMSNEIFTNVPYIFTKQADFILVFIIMVMWRETTVKSSVLESKR